MRFIDEWWSGRAMRRMLPRLFFEHFGDSSLIVDNVDAELVGFLIGSCRRRVLARRMSTSSACIPRIVAPGSPAISTFATWGWRQRAVAEGRLRHSTGERGIDRVPSRDGLRAGGWRCRGGWRTDPRGLRRPWRGPGRLPASHPNFLRRSASIKARGSVDRRRTPPSWATHGTRPRSPRRKLLRGWTSTRPSGRSSNGG